MLESTTPSHQENGKLNSLIPSNAPKLVPDRVGVGMNQSLKLT